MEFPEIPGYKIEREIGSGGMATVFLALQENLHREVALKVMVPGLSADETSCHRFLKEGRIAAQLNHRNLLTVYDIGVHDDQYYMASEYLPGGTVRGKMKDGLTEDEVVEIIGQIAQGLNYAHSKGFVHRDVKPGNLLFRANGDCVLGDFGIAKSVDSNTNATKIGTSIGTPHYMSPEQAKGEKVDHRTDLYSLGVVFYELLTGDPPFDADDPFSVALMQINDPVPQLPGKSSRFQPLIEKLMAKDREQRYETAEAFVEDLAGVSGKPAAKSKPAAPPKPAEPPAPKSAPRSQGKSEEKSRRAARQPKKRAPARSERSGGRSRQLWPWAVLLLMVVAAGVGGWFWYTQGLGERGKRDPGVAEEATPATPTDAGARREQQAQALLEEARDHAEAGRFFAPPENNAYASYQGVLRLDVTNNQARDGLADLVKRVEESAESMREEGDLDGAERLLREGLRHFPADPRLRRQLSRVEGEEAEAQPPTTATPPGETAGDVDRLLLRAGRFFDAAQYSDATPLYRQVLEAEPSNEIARDQLRRIAENWAIAAQNFLQQGDLSTAAGMVDKGLQAQPDDSRLLALKERIEELRAQEGD